MTKNEQALQDLMLSINSLQGEDNVLKREVEIRAEQLEKVEGDLSDRRKFWDKVGLAIAVIVLSLITNIILEFVKPYVPKL